MLHDVTYLTPGLPVGVARRQCYRGTHLHRKFGDSESYTPLCCDFPAARASLYCVPGVFSIDPCRIEKLYVHKYRFSVSGLLAVGAVSLELSNLAIHRRSTPNLPSTSSLSPLTCLFQVATSATQNTHLPLMPLMVSCSSSYLCLPAHYCVSWYNSPSHAVDMLPVHLPGKHPLYFSHPNTVRYTVKSMTHDPNVTKDPVSYTHLTLPTTPYV